MPTSNSHELLQATDRHRPRAKTIGSALSGARLRFAALGDSWRKRVRSLANKAAKDSEGLDRLAHSVERRFVETGDVFRKQVLMNDRIVEQGDRLLQLTTGSSGSDSGLQRALGIVRGNLTFIDDFAGRTMSLLKTLKRYKTEIDKVCRSESQLSKTVIPLQIIERLFRIESASLPPETQSSFASVTQEISSLHTRMRQTLFEQFSGLARSRERTEDATRRLEDHTSRINAQIENTRARIEDSMTSFDHLIEQSQSRNQRLASKARLMADDTTKVMIGLQYQDVFRQKTDHILDAIRAMVELIDSAGGDRESIVYQCAAISELQSLQIASLETDLQNASESVSRNIRQIVAHLDDIERECLSDKTLSANIETNKAIVDTVIDALQNTLTLVKSATSGIDETYASLVSFSGAASDVTSTLRSIAFDIRLIALNAQIQAAQLSGGTGLEVLSETTCEIAEETGQFTSQIGEELDALISLMDETVDECSRLKSVATDRLQLCETEVSQLTAELASSRQQTIDTLQSANGLLRDCRDNAYAMQRKADLSDLPDEPMLALRHSLEELQALSGKLRTRSRSGKPVSTELLDRIQAHYTMDSERAIHAQVSATTRTKAPVAAVPTAEAEIEFF